MSNTIKRAGVFVFRDVQTVLRLIHKTFIKHGNEIREKIMDPLGQRMKFKHQPTSVGAHCTDGFNVEDKLTLIQI